MIYYNTQVLDNNGNEVAQFLFDARDEKQAVELAKLTFSYDHPNVDQMKHQFHAELYRRGN